MSSRHTYEMGVIGNGQSMAYVNLQAEVVWMCAPTFADDLLFASLLDQEKGGVLGFEFATSLDSKKQPKIHHPSNHHSSNQRYVADTNILCTEFSCDGGQFSVSDFMPFSIESKDESQVVSQGASQLASQCDSDQPQLIRRLEASGCEQKIKVVLKTNQDFAKAIFTHPVTSTETLFRFGESIYQLSVVGAEVDKDGWIQMIPGQPVYLVLADESFRATSEDCENRFLQTEQAWKKFLEGCQLPTQHIERVKRSLLVLKLHQLQSTGAIIASGASSLPEAPGAGRNWDYRYHWIRDAFYVLNVFNRCGLKEEAKAHWQFIRRLHQSHGHLTQPMYRVDGQSRIEEFEADLQGYLGEKPVRFGNAAYTQVQNDMFGQLLLSFLYTLDGEEIAREDLQIVEQILEQMLAKMDEPDAGLWELRGQKKFHSYTYLLHWYSCNELLKLADQFSQKIQKLATHNRDAADLKLQRCLRATQGFYSTAIETDDVDAALFQLVQFSYLKERSLALSHCQELYRQLCIDDCALFYRYCHEDDFGKPEVAFLVCGFWFVEAMIRLDQEQSAEKAFSKLLDCSNHLGLMSEDISPENLSQWGNFIQTYSHAGLISCALASDGR